MGPSATAESDNPATGAVQRSFRTALHAVADALTAHGFAAHAERHGGGLRIVSDHCPFGGAAIEHPVVCAVDGGVVRGLLGPLYVHADASTSQSRPMGDDQCITELSSSQAELPRRAIR
jgi:predicted ArsR family transcriptional regulator